MLGYNRHCLAGLETATSHELHLNHGMKWLETSSPLHDTILPQVDERAINVRLLFLYYYKSDYIATGK
jgi:hypothetical protein